MALDGQNCIRRGQTRDGSSRFTITMSPPAIALCGLGFVIILGWCFYMGFMIGRGQNPEDHIKEIAAIFQSSDRGQAEMAMETAAPLPADEALSAQAPPEEQAARPAQPALPQPAPQPTGQMPGYPSFNLTPAAQPAAQPAQQEAQKAAPAPSQAQPKAQAKAEPDAPYTYTYRMATVKSQEAVRSEQDRYEKKGFRTGIKNSGGSWYLTYTFKGSEKDDEAFKQRVRGAGLGAPALMSRKKN